MEKKSQKIADLAGMFDDIDIEVIEGVLEMCKGHVNQAANVLIKMQEDSSAKPSPIQEKKEIVLNDNFLEIPDEETDKKESEINQNHEFEQDYSEDIQKAIELSMQSRKPQTKKNFKEKVKHLFGQDTKGTVYRDKKPNEKIQKTEENSENLNEEVIQFIFNSKILIRGENISNFSNQKKL